ncbi:sulfurtransferase [Hymenobacter cellulosivorans]|uniref:Sulfurtransferase n=1 Tax=Hymenobacter cellulosivorans TaxID=2932249 RepID=A0ABY4F6A7_9BACT|nr:sulfurtransferase [Hymenobacter cellulosivorans]UOQ52208.1 sulfurtransferase [Hymenobacter cellulosivorans]
MQPLISASELSHRLATEPLVLLDARSGPDARARYQAAHLPGALFVDLERDLAHPTDNAAQGGRHPLPPVRDFSHLLGCLGISPETPVVVYDDKSGANAAARTWWMLRSAGHAAVQVLDGGLSAAQAAGLALTDAVEQSSPVSPYPLTGWQLPLAPTAKVQEASETGSALIIDVREAPRYRGETEPIDLVAGHIPGARNVPFAGNLDAAGQYLPAAELRQKYEAVLDGRPAEQVIVHCGSGVTACHTLLAFDQAGLPIPRLYVGSWSEWSRNDFPQATGEE